MSAFKNKIILEILSYYKNLWALNYVSAVSHWDLETYMPAKGAEARGEALAKISTISQKMFLDKHFIDLIHKASDEKDLTDEERGVVRVLLHTLRFYEKLPADFLEEFEKLANTSTVIWREAKEKNEYKIFEPSLSKIFDMSKKMADHLGYKDSPYDALLDQYEEGLTANFVEKYFDSIRSPLGDLLQKIRGSKRFKTQSAELGLHKEKYNRQEADKLNHKFLDKVWGDPQRLRLDISAHPFTTSFSNNDTRITTRFRDTGFSASLHGVIHEFGHALYDLQSHPDLEMTTIGGGSSLVIHESQSRFWENFVGRSEPFINEFLPDFEKVVGRKLTSEEVYFYFNYVEPGLIRVDADEVTYHFHIMLRFEVEKGIIESRIKPHELRDYWNSKMKEYLGIVPDTDSNGIMQDIHWGQGTVGYFPTYSLGTSLSAQWAQKMNNELRIMNYGGIKDWLREYIHKYGSTYTLGELLKKNKMQFDPSVNLNYLEEKYRKIFDF